MKVFLGGTCNNSTWRDGLIPKLNIDYFNPVVDVWNDEAYNKEIEEKASSDYHLYVITPLYEGYYSIAEIVDESYRESKKVLFLIQEEDGGKRFTSDELVSLKKIGETVKKNLGTWFENEEDLIDFLNPNGIIQSEIEHYDFFISYSRNSSIELASYIYNRLTEEGYSVWFDKSNIPGAVDYQQKINDGIRKSNNFIFIVTPRSSESKYCLLEVLFAAEHGKKFIALEQRQEKTKKELAEDVQSIIDDEKISEENKEILIKNVPKWDIHDELLPVVRESNWLRFIEWENKEFLENAIQGIIKVQKDFKLVTSNHTNLIIKAFNWKDNNEDLFQLMPYAEYVQAQEWLVGNHGNDGCSPCELQEDFILANKSFYEGGLTDICLIHFEGERTYLDTFSKRIVENGYSFSTIEVKLNEGKLSQLSIEKITKCVNVISVVSNNLVMHPLSDFIKEQAEEFKKCYFSVQLAPLKEQPSKELVELVDLSRKSHNAEKSLGHVSAFKLATDEFIRRLKGDQEFYNDHNYLLNKALQWELYEKKASLLLYNEELSQARLWLSKTLKSNYKSKVVDIQKSFIKAAEDANSDESVDVLIINDEQESVLTKIIGRDLRLQGKKVAYSLIEDTKSSIEEAAAKANYILLVVNNSEASENLCRLVSSLGKRFLVCHRNNLELEVKGANMKTQAVSSNKTIGGSEIFSFLSVDSNYVAKHSKWLLRAGNWEKSSQNRSKRNEDLLLGRDEYLLADAWLEESADKFPAPTELHKDFITESKQNLLLLDKKEKRNENIKRVLAGLMTVAFVVAVVFYIEADKNETKALFEKGVAERNVEIADSLKIVSDTSAAQAARSEIIAIKNKDLALLNESIAGVNEDVAIANALKAKLLSDSLIITEGELKDNILMVTQQAENIEIARKKAVQSLMLSESKKILKKARNQYSANPKKAFELALSAFHLNRFYCSTELLDDSYHVLGNYYSSIKQKGEKRTTSSTIMDLVVADQFIVTVERNGVLRINDDQLKSVLQEVKLSGTISHVEWDKTSNFVLICNGTNQVSYIDLQDPKQKLKSVELSYPIHFISRIKDEQFIASSENLILHIENIFNTPKVQVLNNKKSNIQCVAFKNGVLAVSKGSQIGTTKLDGVNKIEFNWVEFGEPILCLEVGEKNKVFAGGLKGSVKLLDIQKEVFHSIVKHEVSVTDLLYEEGKIYSVAKDGFLKVAKIQNNQLSERDEMINYEMGYWLRSLALQEDGQWLLLGGEKKEVQFLPISSEVVFYNEFKGQDLRNVDTLILNQNTQEPIQLLENVNCSK